VFRATLYCRHAGCHFEATDMPAISLFLEMLGVQMSVDAWCLNGPSEEEAHSPRYDAISLSAFCAPSR
jgi:hypothetical protein